MRNWDYLAGGLGISCALTVRAVGRPENRADCQSRYDGPTDTPVLDVSWDEESLVQGVSPTLRSP